MQHRWIRAPRTLPQLKHQKHSPLHLLLQVLNLLVFQKLDLLGARVGKAPATKSNSTTTVVSAEITIPAALTTIQGQQQPVESQAMTTH